MGTRSSEPVSLEAYVKCSYVLRMRNSTVLVLSLRSLAHETIKNLVLAGIGRLIIMDDGVVTEEDLGAGFLFREADGAVGQNVDPLFRLYISPTSVADSMQRAEVMKPQIVDLNPRVGVSAFSSLEPFVPGSNGAPSTTNGSDTAAMADFLRNERVDVLVACDLARDRLVRLGWRLQVSRASLTLPAGKHQRCCSSSRDEVLRRWDIWILRIRVCRPWRFL